MFEILPMQQTDLASVLKLQTQCYNAALVESAEIVSQRLMLHPQSCWVAQYHDKIWGYLFACPGLLGQVSALGSEFVRYQQADCLYLHDVAVSRDARGQGVAKALLEHAEQYALSLDLNQIGLVAVQNSTEFWQGLGFELMSDLTEQTRVALASYTEQQACYLTKQLPLLVPQRNN